MSCSTDFVVEVKDSYKDAPTTIKITKLTKKERKPIQKKLRALARKTIRLMPEQELQEAARYCILLQDFEEALIYLKQLTKTTQSVTVAKIAKLEIADIIFQLGNLKDAAKCYEEYITLYPGDKEKVAYASYKGLLSNFYSVLPADRDQTATLKTIELSNNFLSNKSSIFKIYIQEVVSIKNHCLARLWEHDVVVFDFHMDRGTVKSANVCLADAREKLLPLIPEIESGILQCEYKVAIAQKDNQKAMHIAQDLTKRFPGAVRIAQNKKPTNFTNKF